MSTPSPYFQVEQKIRHSPALLKFIIGPHGSGKSYLANHQHGDDLIQNQGQHKSHKYYNFQCFGPATDVKAALEFRKELLRVLSKVQSSCENVLSKEKANKISKTTLPPSKPSAFNPTNLSTLPEHLTIRTQRSHGSTDTVSAEKRSDATRDDLSEELRMLDDVCANSDNPSKESKDLHSQANMTSKTSITTLAPEIPNRDRFFVILEEIEDLLTSITDAQKKREDLGDDLDDKEFSKYPGNDADDPDLIQPSDIVLEAIELFLEGVQQFSEFVTVFIPLVEFPDPTKIVVNISSSEKLVDGGTDCFFRKQVLNSNFYCKELRQAEIRMKKGEIGSKSSSTKLHIGSNIMTEYFILPTPLDESSRRYIVSEMLKKFNITEEVVDSSTNFEEFLEFIVLETAGFLPSDLEAMLRLCILQKIGTQQGSTDEIQKTCLSCSDISRVRQIIEPAVARQAQDCFVPRSRLLQVNDFRGNKSQTDTESNVTADAKSTLDSSVIGLNEVKDAVIERIAGTNETPRFGKPSTQNQNLAFLGPSGSGKTLFSFCLARLQKRNCFLITVGDIMKPKLGDSEKMCAKIFQAAKRSSPSCLIIEGIDILCVTDDKGENFKESSSLGTTARVLATLRHEIDDCVARYDVQVILTALRSIPSALNVGHRIGKLYRLRYLREGEGLELLEKKLKSMGVDVGTSDGSSKFVDMFSTEESVLKSSIFGENPANDEKDPEKTLSSSKSKILKSCEVNPDTISSTDRIAWETEAIMSSKSGTKSAGGLNQKYYSAAKIIQACVEAGTRMVGKMIAEEQSKDSENK